jgi:tRNA pseudouridine13 synthase
MELREGQELEKQIGMQFYSTKIDGIGGVIKTKPSDFRVREITNREEGKEGKYLIVELEKNNWDTHHLIGEFSRQLRIGRKRIGFAGTKDKFAVTTQKISIWDIDEKALEQVRIPDIRIKKIGKSNKAVSLGDLYGNEFDVIIRDVEVEGNGKGNKEEVKRKIDAITNEIENGGGVPNFFGVQRFGISRPITHIVGKHLIKGEIDQAVMVYIGEVFPGESQEAQVARELCLKGELKESLKQMPKFLGYERAMLNVLVKNESEPDFISAFGVLPKTLQKLFVHAYQSYLFNLILSQRMDKNMVFNQALVGDEVCFCNEFGFAEVNKMEKVTVDTLEGINRLIKRSRAFITAPILGYETEFTGGEVGEIERRVLEDEGIKLNHFLVEKIPEISSKGTRRPILVPMKMIKREIGDDELSSGLKVGLNFFLPKGSYATVVLREYVKR